MKFLVTGAEGMLGREVCLRLKGLRMDYRGMSHNELDITDKDRFAQVLRQETPDIVVNCAGVVKGRDEDLMFSVNTEAPARMANECGLLGIRMVQVSTDCVFLGEEPNDELDYPDAQDDYGYSKAEGEIFHGNHLTIRCSFIGFGSRGLINWLMNQKGEVSGYANVQWNGMTSRYAAWAIVDFALKDVRGILHIFGEDTTKYDVLKTINEVLGLGLQIKSVDEPVLDRRLRTITDFNVNLPPLKEQLREVFIDYRGSPSRPE